MQLCANPEVTKDHVLTSAYVKIFRAATRNDVNIDKAPRLSITIVIWILSSDTLFVTPTNSIQIVRRQWCRWFDSADVITMNLSIRVQLPGHDSSKNGQLAMFRSPHLRVVFHPGANSVIMMLISVKTTPPHSSFKNYFVIPEKFQNHKWCLCIK